MKKEVIKIREIRAFYYVTQTVALNNMVSKNILLVMDGRIIVLIFPIHRTSHIPAFSRVRATKMFWDWSKAGQLDENKKDIIQKDADGTIVCHSKKGAFKWEKNIRPVYAWWNVKLTRTVLGDRYDSVPIDLGSPIGDINDTESKLYPFKVMKGIGSRPGNKAGARAASLWKSWGK
jgi:hypothetical protein